MSTLPHDPEDSEPTPEQQAEQRAEQQAEQRAEQQAEELRAYCEQRGYTLVDPIDTLGNLFAEREREQVRNRLAEGRERARQLRLARLHDEASDAS